MTEDSTVPVFDFNGNPWQVDDIAGLFTLLVYLFIYQKDKIVSCFFTNFFFSVFSYFCCPECVYRAKTVADFQVHAIVNHPDAKDFFERYGNLFTLFTFFAEFVYILNCLFTFFQVINIGMNITQMTS